MKNRKPEDTKKPEPGTPNFRKSELLPEPEFRFLKKPELFRKPEPGTVNTVPDFANTCFSLKKIPFDLIIIISKTFRRFEKFKI